MSASASSRLIVNFVPFEESGGGSFEVVFKSTVGIHGNTIGEQYMAHVHYDTCGDDASDEDGDDTCGEQYIEHVLQ